MIPMQDNRPAIAFGRGGEGDPRAAGAWFGGLRRLLAAFAALALPAVVFALALGTSGCTADDRTAGGDDFPNSVETLGKSAAAEGDEDAGAEDWNAYDDAPSTPPEMYDSTRAPDAPPEDDSGAATTKAAADALIRLAAQPEDRVPPGREIADAVRSVTRTIEAPGLARAVRVQTIPGVTARDTTWYRTDSLLPLVEQRVLRVSGEVAYAARTERFSFEDADGDSILSARPGSRNLSRARFTVEHANGRVEERVVVMGAGPDRLFDTPEDNALRSLELARYDKEGDTLERLSLRPVAPDSLVRAPGRDSGLVETEHFTAAAGARVTRRYRTLVFADSSRNRALRFTRVRETSAGTFVTEARGRDSLPDFGPGETGVIVERFTPAETGDAADTLASVRTVRRVRLSDEAGKRAGDRLLRIERTRTYRAGAVASLRWILRPASPGRPGEAVRAGEAELRLEWRDGGWIEFTGESDSSGFFGTWTDSRGESGTVRFDASGSIVTGAP